ncbi:MCMBP family protein [Megaselia abdita]
MDNLKVLKIVDFVQNESQIVETLKDLENWKSIPLLDHSMLHSFQDNTLVRFRGMVQDMLDNETYLEKYKVNGEGGSSRVQDGKFRDIFVLGNKETVDHNDLENCFGERRSLFVISLPGLNDWAKTTQPISPPTQSASESSGQKRSAEDSESMEQDQEMEETQTPNKRIKGSIAVNEEAAPKGLSAEYHLNSPIPDRPSKACMVKVYSDLDSHTLNSVVDVIGFLSVDPAMDISTADVEMNEDIDGILAANPPPSLIPRIHAVAIRRLKHSNPLLDTSLHNFEEHPLSFDVVYKDLLIVLTQCLFGDTLAAEYLLAHLISTVYVRTELETLGQFTLNLCSIPQEVLPFFTKTLYEIIEMITPVSHYLPMTLENMNTLQFIPKKDYQTNKLVSGILQLAPHTHLVLDETAMKAGKLENNGVLGMQFMSHLIKTQQLKCDFQYYQLDFHSNLAILILSEGRSMLPNNSQVPIQPSDNDTVKLIEETLKSAKFYLRTKLNSIRRYLTLCKVQEFVMNDVEGKMIEDDFVEMRKANKNIGPEQLHNLLVLSRLLGIGVGQTALSKDSWLKAKDMERQREERLAKLPKRKV